MYIFFPGGFALEKNPPVSAENHFEIPAVSAFLLEVASFQLRWLRDCNRIIINYIIMCLQCRSRVLAALIYANHVPGHLHNSRSNSYGISGKSPKKNPGKCWKNSQNEIHLLENPDKKKASPKDPPQKKKNENANRSWLDCTGIFKEQATIPQESRKISPNPPSLPPSRPPSRNKWKKNNETE